MRFDRFVGFAWTVLLLLASTAGAANDAQLADAAEKQDAVAIRALLEQDIDVNAAQADGMTALHWAAYHDELKTVQHVIQAGADSRAANRYGVTPLSLACLNGNAAIVELLLEAGADPNTALLGGETALMTASRTGRRAAVEALLAGGADANAHEDKGQTALMWAAAEGHTEVVDALLEAGADFRTQLRSGFTALFFAVREGHTDTVFRLLAAGCDVNDVMRSQRRSGSGRGRMRTTPLVLAVEDGHFELAQTLLKAGAEPDGRPSGFTALHAISWVRKPIRGDGDPPPIGSGSLSSLDIVRELVSSGADINARLERGQSAPARFTTTGSTAFELAARASDLPLMRLLVELGADPLLPNADNCTPLMAAVGVGALGDGDESAGTEEEAIEAVQFLLELGANIDAVDDHGETAMHGAAYQSRAKLVQLLADNGADIQVWNRKNDWGWTPRMIALGYRPGNFRPASDTIAVFERVMRAEGVEPPAKETLAAHSRTYDNDAGLRAAKKRPREIKDVEFARVGQDPLQLDLYLPAKSRTPRLIVWVHGGAWRSGSRENMPLIALVQAGWAVASVDYRLSPISAFPAQVHDIKAAIRYLRANAERYGYDAKRIAIAGASAGGHLAALVGTTNGVPELEGTVGSHLGESSDVSAIVDYYGPTNFLTILKQSTPHGLGVRIPALQLLLRAQPEDKPDLAKLASPVFHVDSKDPPLLLVHGDQDPQVPINQSHELQGRYNELGLPIQFEIIHGGAHGGPQFYDNQRLEIVRKFLEQNLSAAVD
jgi:ankyrin repeat protein/acetyl esterase/lipase